jgi:sensor domain CHASE-containing protein
MIFVLIQAASLIVLFQFGFQAIEKYMVQKNFQFCMIALQNELKSLDGLTFEWSSWDDTGLFIEGKKQNYIEENLKSDTLVGKNIDVLCFLDLHGKPVWSRFVKTHGKESRSIDLSMFSEEALQKNPTLWNHKDPNSCVSGYCSTEGGVMIICSRPVTNNKNENPIHGTVIFGRFVTDQLIDSIAKQTCLNFKWWNLRTEYTRSAVENYLSKITPQEPILLESEGGAIAAYAVLRDIDKKDAILIKFLLANEIASYKNSLILKCLGIYFIECLIFLVSLAAFANRQCMDCRSQSKQADESLPTAEYSSFEQMSETQSSAEDPVLTNSQRS